MGETNTDVMRGTFSMLTLKAFSLGPGPGFGFARRVKRISRVVFNLNPGLGKKQLEAER